MRHASALAGLLLALGCAGARAPRPPGSVVQFSEALPVGYESLGTVHADCRVLARDRVVMGAPVTSLACRQSELERALVEQANARGGTVLARERCYRASAHLACSALVAGPLEGAVKPAKSAFFGANDDEGLPATVARHVLIDVEPRGARFERRARAAGAVTEFVGLPVGHVELGVMRAHCDESACDDAQARAGLRLAAGGLGVSDLVGVRCFALEGERACVATLAESERDPETDPSAR